MIDLMLLNQNVTNFAEKIFLELIEDGRPWEEENVGGLHPSLQRKHKVSTCWSTLKLFFQIKCIQDKKYNVFAAN